MCLFLSDSAQFQLETTVPCTIQSYHKVITTKCLLYSFLRYLSVFFFCLILCIRFVFGISARFKPKKSHASVPHDHCSSFRVSLSSLCLSCFFIHIHLSRLHAQFVAIHTHVRVCIFMYKQALRGVDSDPDSRADKNSSQSIIRFMNMYV